MQSRKQLYTVVLWSGEEDSNSISPLEASEGDYDVYTDKLGVHTESYYRALEEDTGYHAYIYKGIVNNPEAPWCPVENKMVDTIYVEHDWDNLLIAALTARMLKVTPDEILVKRPPNEENLTSLSDLASFLLKVIKLISDGWHYKEQSSK